MAHWHTRAWVALLVTATAAGSAHLLGSQIQRLATAPPQPWSGSAQCVLDVAGPRYAHRETHRWVIVGPATMRSNVEVYPTRWTVSGDRESSLQRATTSSTIAARWSINAQPANVELGVTVHADRVTLQELSARTVSRAALSGVETTTSAGVPRPRTIVLDVDEWRFPKIEDAPTSTRLAGSSTTPFDGARAPMAPAGSQGTATCTWAFTRGAASSPLSPATSNGARDAVAAQPRSTPSAVEQPAGTAPAGTPVLRAPSTRVAVPGGNPTSTLSTPTPTAPAPTGFRVDGAHGMARLRWDASSGRSYVLFRADGPATWIPIPMPTCCASSFDDVVPDPRVTYRYRLVANHADGTWGEAFASYLSPPPLHPTGFRATMTAPGVVKLQWNAIQSAVSYRIDGSGLPITGLSVTGATEATITPVPHGVPQWQLAAIYPGNYADYTGRPVASTVDLSRPLPSHAPKWLSKTAGEGAPSETTAHYSRLCGPRAQANGCRDLGEYILSWGAPQDVTKRPRPVKYDNLTDLGSSRETTCYLGEPFEGSRALLCYTESDRGIGLIVMNNEGARFGVFNPISTSPTETYSFDWGLAKLTTTAEFDSEGAKKIPHSCISCHGGTYDPVSGLVKGASLLPIDPGVVQLKGDPAEAQEQLRTFNSLIRATYSSPAVSSYITGLYGGMVNNERKVDFPGTPALDNYVPAGWAAQRDLYLNVVKKDCQMCHLPRPDLSFFTADDFMASKTLIHTAVCKARSMPHSEIPFMRFWTSKWGNTPTADAFARALGFPGCS
jgi:hypothetical protein